MGLPKTWIANELLTSAALNAQFVYVNSLVPVGTILPWDDHDGAVTFDTNIFVYCNGQTINDALSPLNGKVITDMSNRYLVGFGTEAGGDIGTAAWSATIVGNANHQVNLQHLHSQTVHAHAHTHTHEYYLVVNHTHLVSGLTGSVSNSGSNPGGHAYYSRDNVNGWINSAFLTCGGGANEGQHYHDLLTVTGGTADISSQTGGASTTNTSNSAAVNTGNGLSTTESIQPRSRKVRYIERYK